VRKAARSNASAQCHGIYSFDAYPASTIKIESCQEWLLLGAVMQRRCRLEYAAAEIRWKNASMKEHRIAIAQPIEDTID
jgi:hypothetical protein